MAETIDLIEESNDELENLMCYKNEPNTQESTDINSFTDIDGDHQLICIDSANAVASDENLFQYEDDNNQSADDKELGQPLQNNVDDTSEHNLILKETIDDNGQLLEEYFCQKCNISYNSIEHFLGCHPLLELLKENPEGQENLLSHQLQKQEAFSIVSEHKLWDLVENSDETYNYIDEEEKDDIEIKPNIALYDNCSQEKEVSNNSIEADKEHYFCYDCQQVFSDLATAENHDCNDELLNSNNFSKSNSTLHEDSGLNDNNVYRCHLCDKDYTSFRSFSNHQRWHKRSENLLGHTKTLHDVPSVCEICNTIFESEKNLKLHMKMHKKHTLKTIQEALPAGAQNEYNDLNQFFCEICNKSFDQKLLVIHKNMHQNLEEYSCGKCNKNFENLPSYEIHMNMHGDNFKTISAAKKTNTTQDIPSTSAQSFVGGGKRKHACQYCGKEFQRPYEKVKHERIHTGEKPYECEVCGKTFRVSYSLTLHLRTHTDIRPYVCATCNKRFKQQSVYVHHLKTHEVECSYKCNICGKSFRTSVQLSGHKNIHSKPYNCTDCNRPFASLYAVKIHMKTHNKFHKSNKNLKNRCSICGASYARVFALSLHMKEQHGINVDAKLMETNNSSANSQNELGAETALLINAAVEASNQQMHFINDDDEEDNEDIEANECLFVSQVDHEENIQNSLTNNVYIDETEAATQAILNTDDGIFNSHADHEANIRNALSNNVYIDETEAAAQTILNKEAMSVDNFPAEEIIPDWLSK